MADEAPKPARGGVLGGLVRATIGREGCEQVVPLRRSVLPAAEWARRFMQPPTQEDRDRVRSLLGD